MSKGNVPGVIGTGLRQFSGILNVTDLGGNSLITATSSLVQIGNPSAVSQVTLTAPIVFLDGDIAGLGASSGLPVDMSPDSGSFPTTTAGFTTTVGPTISWYKVGQMVVLTIPDFDQASNTTVFTLFGVPTHLLPSRSIVLAVPAATNNVFISTAFMVIESATSGQAGQISVFPGPTTSNVSWTNFGGNDKGFGWSFGDVTRAQCFTYQLI